jgi:hypothetical protein
VIGSLIGPPWLGYVAAIRHGVLAVQIDAPVVVGNPRTLFVLVVLKARRQDEPLELVLVVCHGRPP